MLFNLSSVSTFKNIISMNALLMMVILKQFLYIMSCGIKSVVINVDYDDLKRKRKILGSCEYLRVLYSVVSEK